MTPRDIDRTSLCLVGGTNKINSYMLRVCQVNRHQKSAPVDMIVLCGVQQAQKGVACLLWRLLRRGHCEHHGVGLSLFSTAAPRYISEVAMARQGKTTPTPHISLRRRPGRSAPGNGTSMRRRKPPARAGRSPGTVAGSAQISICGSASHPLSTGCPACIVNNATQIQSRSHTMTLTHRLTDDCGAHKHADWRRRNTGSDSRRP